MIMTLLIIYENHTEEKKEKKTLKLKNVRDIFCWKKKVFSLKKFHRVERGKTSKVKQ